MNRFRLVRALTAAVCVAGPCVEAQHERNTGDVKFWAVADLSYDPTEPALLGARVADPRDYTSVLYSAARRERCTSTLIGPRVLLTAAHCVGDGATAELQIARIIYRSACTHAPDYANNDTADWALCLIDRPVPDVAYETVNTRADLLTLGGPLLLSGFGCTRADGTGDGIYRIGESPVSARPSGANNDIVTTGSVALCYGDSGGPAFAYLDDLKLHRVQVSVNSRSNIRDTSHLSSLSTTAALDFLRDWMRRNTVEICGLSPSIAGCRL